MERYTENHYDGNGYYLICSGNCETLNCGDCDILDEIVDRLAAYEDTGLEPEDFKRSFDEGALLKLTGQFLGVTPDRLRELAQADREGRCGIPPVKLHQKIFRVFNGEIYEEMVCGAIWEPFMPRPRWKVFVMGSGLPYYWDDVFGKTVFLTREEAEAAVKEQRE